MNEFVKNIREASDESADEIIEQIKASHKVSRVIGWPGHEDIKVEMRLLNMSECRQAKIDNQLEFKKAGIELSVANLADYREQEVVHGLWRACYNPATGERIFRNAEDLRKSCTPDELLYLSGEFNSFVEELDPNINKLSDEDFESLKELLKKNAGPDSIESHKLAFSLEASAYFGCPATQITDAQWLLVFALKGLLGKSTTPKDDGDFAIVDNK